MHTAHWGKQHHVAGWCPKDYRHWKGEVLFRVSILPAGIAGVAPQPQIWINICVLLAQHRAHLACKQKYDLKHVYKFYTSTPFLYLPRSFVVSGSNISLLAGSDEGSFCLVRCCFMLFSVKREHVILAFICGRRRRFHLCLTSGSERLLSSSRA